jgi:FkbM family methyltransferase
MKRQFQRGLPVFAAVNGLQRLLSKNDAIVRFAAKARNQCNRVIAYSFALTPDRRHNGEDLLVQAVGDSVSSFIDVGANQGDWTELMLSATGGRAAGWLLEPGEAALARLRIRFQDRLGHGLTVLSVAAADREGSARFFEEPDAGETSSLVAGASVQGAAARSVSTVTLDSVLEGIPGRAVDFLKVDAEGFDGRVLLGCMNAFTEHRVGIVQFEYNGPWRQAGTTLAGICSELSSRGYVVRVLRPEGLRRFDLDAAGEFFGYANFVAFSPAIQRDRSHPIHRVAEG